MGLLGLASGKGRSPVPTKGQRDPDLIERIRRGDLRAFEELYRSYHPRLTRFLTNLIRRPQMVEEVLNDTMMVVWQKAASFAGESKLSTWIFAIAYRKAMKALRRYDEPMEDNGVEIQASEADDPDRETGHRQIHIVLAAALKELSPDHRAVVDLTYFHEMGYREIADILGCPVDTVKTRMFHARRHLKRRLGGELADFI